MCCWSYQYNNLVSMATWIPSIFLVVESDFWFWVVEYRKYFTGCFTENGNKLEAKM